MPNSIGQFVKLRDCIYMYSEAAKQSEASFLRLWRMAFRGLIQMGLNAFWQSKTVELPVNENMTVTLPGDLIQWIAIGINGDNGEIRKLRVNDNLSSLRANDLNRVSGLTAENLDGLTDYLGSIKQDTTLTDTCKVDLANHCILLNTGFTGSKIVFEYLGSPQEDSDYEIPIQFQEAMIAWLGWKDIEHAPISRFNNTSKREAAFNFGRQMKLAKRMYKPVRVQDMERYYHNVYKI